MKETYWNQFISSGRIDDYLNYKMHEKYSRETADVTENSNPAQSCGKEKRESDRTYGNGTLDHAHR
nr:hypothetical protein [uncultured Mediterraneibacter sp.]